MSRPRPSLDDLAIAYLLLGGLVTLAAHPCKTWRLVRHNVGWYE